MLALIFKVINIKTKYSFLVSTIMANLQKMILKVPILEEWAFATNFCLFILILDKEKQGMR